MVNPATATGAPGAERSERSDRVPVTVITGFLGSGKTTLLNRLLAAGGGRAAVIENEFGAVGIDAELIDRRAAAVSEIVAGCICCGSLAELNRALDDLAADRGLGRLLIETSGLANPEPILRSLVEARSHRRWILDSLIAAADPLTLGRRALPPEAAAQIAPASVVLINKVDLLGPSELRIVRERIRTWNPDARVIDCVHCELPPDLLRRRNDFAAMRALEIEADEGDLGPASAHVHSEVEQISLTIDGELEWERTNAWLAGLRLFEGDRLLRLKGVLAVRGERRKVVVQGVHSYIEAQAGELWTSAPRRSRIVLIGRDLDAGFLERSARECAVRPRPRGPQSQRVVGEFSSVP